MIFFLCIAFLFYWLWDFLRRNFQYIFYPKVNDCIVNYAQNISKTLFRPRGGGRLRYPLITSNTVAVRCGNVLFSHFGSEKLWENEIGSFKIACLHVHGSVACNYEPRNVPVSEELRRKVAIDRAGTREDLNNSLVL